MKLNLFFVVALLSIPTLAGVSVENVVIRQNWPWDSKVFIGYDLVSDDASARYSVDVKVEDSSGALTIFSKSFSGDLDDQVAGAGKRIVWDPAESGYGAGLVAVGLRFTVAARPVIGPEYIIVDLSNGPSAASYGVSTLASHTGGWAQNPYKKTSLVLKRVRAGTFQMGSPTDEGGRKSNEQLHTVVLTNDFYLGVFPLTHKQVHQITNINTVSVYDTYPMLGVSWDQLCGAGYGNTDNSTEVSGSSILGLLNARTAGNANLPAGYVFALPSEAQWEYACRAGTTTAWNNGTDYSAYTDDNNKTWDDNLTLLGWYLAVNTLNSTTDVGKFGANAWGFYDFHGNCWELTFDGMVGDGNGALGSETVVEPRYKGYTGYRICRGGCWQSNPADCRSARRNYQLRSKTSDSKFGARIALIRAN